MPHKIFPAILSQDTGMIEFKLALQLLSTYSAITIVSECYQMGFCFHVSFFFTLPFLSCKGLTLQVIDWPATPTVAAPAPMNLAAESTSCTWELVWKPRQATDNMGEEGKAWKKKKKRKIYQQIQ